MNSKECFDKMDERLDSIVEEKLKKIFEEWDKCNIPLKYSEKELNKIRGRE